MGIPAIVSISPTSGLAVGDVFVTIRGSGFNVPSGGGTLNVRFGGVPAIRAGAIDPTRIICTAPPGDPDSPPVDVTVENVTPNLSGPPSVQSVTLAGGFTYVRAPIATPSDLSNHAAVGLVTRALLLELRRAVLKNTHHDMHPDFATAVDAAVPQTTRADVPSLKILGPKIVEDRWNSRNDPPELDEGGGDWSETFPSTTVELHYDLVGVARTPDELAGLWTEAQRYFAHVDYLQVPIPSSKLGAEVAQYELQAVWEERGEFRSHATRQGLAQFTQSFVVRGVTLSPDARAWASFEVDQVDITDLRTAPPP